MNSQTGDIFQRSKISNGVRITTMQSIQLPTSTDQLGAAFMRHFEFVVNTDVEKERRENDPFSLKGLLYANFDKQAEIKRLTKLAMALDSGVKTLEFA